MKKGLLSAIIFSLAVTFSSHQAHAIVIGIDPSSQVVPVGNPFTVGLTISGLGSGSVPSLGTFDVDLTFDPAILSFGSVSYGDPVLGDQLDLSGLGAITITTPGAGSVNLFELSLDLPDVLDTLQADSFTLATLTFDPLSLGTSQFNLLNIKLGDAVGNALLTDVRGGSVSVVPEPATILLLASGLGALGLGNWKRRRQG